MHPAVAQHRASIAAICQRYGIRRLAVFGSAARGGDFVAESSDADFLVEFELASRIPDVQQIVAFRNQLIHGYATVNPETVGHIAQSALPGLLATVQGLLIDATD